MPVPHEQVPIHPKLIYKTRKKEAEHYVKDRTEP